MGLELLVTGSGRPVTVVAHGLGGSLAETRPLVSGVPGTRVLYAARGHGSSPPPDTAGYGELADDLLTVADAHHATQALGVSMGAASLLRLLAARPDRFEKVVLFLPGALDRPRNDLAVRRLEVLAAALGRGDRPAVLEAVRQELPDDLRDQPAAASYAQSRTDFLLGCTGLTQLMTALPADVPVRDGTSLASVSAEVLVLAQEGDQLHPAQVARELVGLLPKARLVVFDQPGVLFRERARLRELVSGFLAGAD